MGPTPLQFDAPTVRATRNWAVHDLDLSSGLADVVLNIPGDSLYVDLLSTGYAYAELNQYAAGGLAPVTISAGATIDADFIGLRLNAPAQLNKTLRLVFCVGARLRPGSMPFAASNKVSSVDGAKARTEDLSAFMGHVPTSAVPAQFSLAQIWNPAGSGKNVFVERINAGSTVAGIMYFLIDTTAAASVYGTNFSSKKANYTTLSQCQRRHDYIALGALAGSRNLATRNLPANDNVTLEFKEPLLIPPGSGASVQFSVANTATNADFEFFEE